MALTQPKWSDCPYGKTLVKVILPIMLAIVGLLGVAVCQLLSVRGRIIAVETNVTWLCKSQGMGFTNTTPVPSATVFRAYPSLDDLPN